MIVADRIAFADERAPLADPFEHLDTGDCVLRGIVTRLRRAAKSEIPILLRGETGTGKELFARAIHRASARSARMLVAVNCASIPESLIESELFGYKPGAFTGASARGGRGLVQQADGGTLFLDEIGDMPLALQSRLLRVLAEGEMTPLGAERPVKVDFRIVCATHRDLDARVTQGLFREDLLFRLRGLCILLPPLRQRSDLPDIVACILKEQSERSGRAVTLADSALAQCRGLPWPGNVRQLKQALHAASALAESGHITALDFEEGLRGIGEPPSGDRLNDPRPAAPADEAGGDERTVLLSCLRRNRWNISKTATEMGASRTTIYRRMVRLSIVAPHLRDV